MAGELLLGGHLAAGQQPLACDEPAGERQQRQDDQPACRPLRGGVAARRERPRRAVGPGAEEPKCLEEDDNPCPEPEPAPEAAQRRSERDAPTPAAREEV